MNKICVQFDVRKKNNKAMLQNDFRAQIHRTVPQNIGGQIWNTFGLFFFLSENESKKPRNIFGTEKFQDYFWKRTPANSLEAPLFSLAKSIYYHGRLPKNRCFCGRFSIFASYSFVFIISENIQPPSQQFPRREGHSIQE